MIHVAERMKHFHTSVFSELLEEKIRYQNLTGNQVLDFSLGSPNIAPSPDIIKALEKAVQIPDNYKYAVTILPAMLESIQEWYLNRYQVSLNKDEIVLLQGSQEALVNLPLIYCNPGDGILVPDPYYPVYVDAPRLAQADILYMPLTEENEYLINLDAITPEMRRKAKMMIVCYPNNPTGAIAPDWFIEKLIRFAKENEILIVYDNAYSEIIFDGQPGPSFLAFEGAREVGVEINSFSKTYGMAGARLGVLLGNKDVIAAYKVLKSNMDYGIFLPIQEAGITALHTGNSLIKDTRTAYQTRRDLMIRLFAEAGWKLPVPKATMFIWAPIPSRYADSISFCRDLLRATGILVTPGIAFGEQGNRYVRLALVQNSSSIREAAFRLKESGFFD